GLAVWPAGPGGRDLRLPAAGPRGRSRRGRPAVQRGPGHRRPGGRDGQDRSRAEQPGVLLRAPGQGGVDLMRAAVSGLGTPYPLGSLLPAIYQSDPASMAWTAGFDDVL